MTLYSSTRTTPFTKTGFKHPRAEYLVDKQLAKDKDIEEGRKNAAKEEGDIYTMFKQIAPRLGFIGDVVPFSSPTDSGGKFYFIAGDTYDGDKGKNRTIVNIDPYGLYNYLRNEEDASIDLRQFEDKWLRTVGSFPAERYAGLKDFVIGKPHMVGKRLVVDEVPGTYRWNKQYRDKYGALTEEAAGLPDFNRALFTKRDVRGEEYDPSKFWDPVIKGATIIMPFIETPGNADTLHGWRDLKKQTASAPENEEEIPDAIPAANDVVDTSTLTYDPVRGEYISETGEVVADRVPVMRSLSATRKRRDSPSETSIEKSAGTMFTEMRAARMKKKDVVTDDSGNVDIVKSSTHSLFKSRMRGNR